MDLNHEDDDSNDEGGSENTSTKESVKEQEVKQFINENISQEVKMMPPLLPLKFGNGLLLQYTVNTPGRDDKLYIAIPGDDNGVIGSRVFLLDLCLLTGSITIFLTVLQSIGKIALLVSMRDGVLDTEESKIVRLVHLSRYLLAGVQFVMFSHCMEILAVREHRIEYLCPRNLLSICILLSSSAMLAGLVAISMGIYIVI